METITYRKLLHKVTTRILHAGLLTAASLMMAVPTFAQAPPPVLDPTEMADYTSWAGWAKPDLTLAIEWDLMQGYTSGAMNPQNNINRAEFATMLAKAMGNSLPDPSQNGTPFTPQGAEAPPSWSSGAIQSLTGWGVFKSFVYTKAQSPNFWNQPITRGEAASWLAFAHVYMWGYMENGHSYSNNNNGFSDLPPSAPGYHAIMLASDEGIIKGFPDGTFRPSAPILRDQAAAMLVRFVKGLPGYEQLRQQTPWLPQLIHSYLHPTTDSSCQNGCSQGSQAVLTSSDAGGIVTTPSSLQTEPSLPWPSVHGFLATHNWIGLAEAKLTPKEADYVANYGLQPWDVAMLALVSSSFWDSSSHDPLGLDLGLKPWTGGSLTPVDTIAWGNSQYPLLPEAQGWKIDLIMQGTGGTQNVIVNVEHPLKNGSPTSWIVQGIQKQ